MKVDFGHDVALVGDLLRDWKRGKYQGILDRIDANPDKRNYPICLLHLITLQRIGLEKQARQALADYESIAYQFGFDKSLFQLALGLRELPYVLALADGNKQELRAMAVHAVGLASRQQEASAWQFLAFQPKTPGFERDLLAADMNRRSRKTRRSNSFQRAKELLSLDELEAAQQALASSVQAHQRRFNELGEHLLLAAQIHLRQDLTFLALAYYAEAVHALKRQFGSDDPVTCQARLEYAQVLERERRFYDAAAQYQLLLQAGTETSANGSRAHFGLANCLFEIKSYEQCQTHYSLCIEHLEQHEQLLARRRKGLAAMRTKNVDVARENLEDIHNERLKVERFGGLSYFDLAALETAQGNGAEDLIQQGLDWLFTNLEEGQQGTALAYRRAGDTLARARLLAEALHCYELAFFHLPDQPHFHTERITLAEACARACKEINKAEEARDYIAQGLTWAQELAPASEDRIGQLQALQADLDAFQRGPR